MNVKKKATVAALQAILRIGALERFFRPEGSMNDSVQALPIDLQKFEKILNENFEI